jgi:hypothetical protein
MIFAGLVKKSTKGSYRFRVYSAFKSRENRLLAGVGGRCCHLAETTWPMDRSVNIGFILVFFRNISSSFHRFRDNSAFESRKRHSEGKSAAGGAI